MATKSLLVDLTRKFAEQTGHRVDVLSMGGVDAVQRVSEGGPFDLVMLARNAIDKLAAGGFLLPESLTDVVDSGVAVAVRAGAARPDIRTEAALRAAVRAAPRLAYSTGPSGVQLARLFDRWGLSAELAPKLVTAPPGVPVGSLVAAGQVDLGFQQLSELMHLDGIDLLGPLPDEVQITTTFSVAIASTCQQTPLANGFLQFVRSPERDALKQAHGMSAPASARR